MGFLAGIFVLGFLALLIQIIKNVFKVPRLEEKIQKQERELATLKAAFEELLQTDPQTTRPLEFAAPPSETKEPEALAPKLEVENPVKEVPLHTQEPTLSLYQSPEPVSETPPKPSPQETPEPPSPFQDLERHFPSTPHSKEETHPEPAPAFLDGIDLKALLLGNNPLVRGGMVLFLIGIAFFLRVAAQKGLLPIELRLGGSALTGTLLLILGWKTRNKKQAWALPMQGGALGIILLTIFAGFRMYSVLPQLPAFIFAVLVVALTAVLGVLQNSQALTFFAFVSGFAAPIALSSGSGNHVALFSYYAILNLGILGAAFYRNWRWLNLAGFFFTYGIGAWWGTLKYSPESFASSEFFLILFYAIFSVTGVLFAGKEYRGRRGYVDGALVFALPLITFSMQAKLVEKDPYWLAWSAAVMGAHYLFTAKYLLKSKIPGRKDMAEAMIVMGICLASLAVPLGFSDQWIAITWAGEGLGLVWLGLRQTRLAPRFLGIALMLGASIYLFQDTYHFKNLGVHALVTLVLSVLLWTGAYWIHKKETLAPLRLYAPYLLLLLSFIQGLYQGNQIIEPSVTGDQAQFHSNLLWSSLWTLAFYLPTLKFKWVLPVYFSGIGSMLLLSFALLIQLSLSQNISAHYGALAWGLSLSLWILMVYLNRRHRRVSKKALSAGVGLLYFSTFLLLLNQGLYSIKDPNWKWVLVGFLLVLSIALPVFEKTSQLLQTKFYHHFYLREPFLLFLFPSAAWLFLQLVSNGKTPPLLWIPGLNPFDILALCALTLLIKMRHQTKIAFYPQRGFALFSTVGVFFILWLTTTLFRISYHWAGLPWTEYLLRDNRVQAALSILWGTTALCMMLPAAKKGLPFLWKGGAFMLALVTLKLFFVDLGESGTTARIISFMGVGALVLIIGYFAPLPTSDTKNTEVES